MQEEIIRAERLETNDAYMPQPTLVVAIEEHVWIQILSAIDVSALSKGTQFCDKMGYDVRPILMVFVKPNTNKEIEPLHWVQDEIVIWDLSPTNEDGYLVDVSSLEIEHEKEEDHWVTKKNMEKNWELLSHRSMDSRNKPPTDWRKIRRKCRGK